MNSCLYCPVLTFAGGLQLQEHPGEVSEYAIEKVKKLVDSLPRDYDSIAAWLGRHVTEARGLPDASPPDTTLTLGAMITRFQARYPC